MKRILLLVLCVLLMTVFTVTVSADGAAAESSEETMTEVVVEYVKSHVEEISVIVSLVLAGFYEVRKHGKLNNSIGTLNNNAISIAENSAKSIKEALAEAEDIANVVKEYKEEFAALLGEVRNNAEEKQSLEDTLHQVKSFLKTAKMANLELSKEVAELLVLANIPNSVKEDLTARHLKAVRELEAVEEVMDHDGKEA